MNKDMGASADAETGSSPTGQANLRCPAASRCDPAREARYEYRFSLRNGRERHDWCLIGDEGAINIWAEPTASAWRDERWFGGIEGHSATPLDYSGGHHEHCWLLGKECWHDGSSLQFSEQVEPFLPEPVGRSMAATVGDNLLPILRSRYRSWLCDSDNHKDDA